MSADAAVPEYAFELMGGRVIRLQSLDQFWTYGGLLAGRPTREMNRRIMDQLVARHTRPNGHGVPVLFEPIETTVGIERPASESQAATLPAATCIAQFTSDVLPDDAESILSQLCVIWFQDDFAYPIDPVVKVELAALDWEAQAAGWLP